MFYGICEEHATPSDRPTQNSEVGSAETAASVPFMQCFNHAVRAGICKEFAAPSDRAE